MKAVRLKSLKIGIDDKNDYYVSAQVEDTGGNIRFIHHTMARGSYDNWDGDYNGLISAVLREARDFS